MTMNEVAAADKLGVARSTLNWWRRKGLINPVLFTEKPRKHTRSTTPARVAYFESKLEDVNAGKLTLLIGDPE